MPPLARFVLPLSLTCLLSLAWPGGLTRVGAQRPQDPVVPPVITVPAGSASVEQTAQGERPAPVSSESFDGLGVGFEGPQGTAARAQSVRQQPRRRSRPHRADRELADGDLHEEGRSSSTRPGACCTVRSTPTTSSRASAARARRTNNGDAVVRYDQLADRWLIVMPIFRRGPARPDQPADWTDERAGRT